MKKILLIVAIAILFAALGIYAATKLYGHTTQEKGIEKAASQKQKPHEPFNFMIPRPKPIQYQIVRDTVYVDRLRTPKAPYLCYEIESGQDSIWLYYGKELIGVVGRKEATVFLIDSLIIVDNL